MSIAQSRGDLLGSSGCPNYCSYYRDHCDRSRGRSRLSYFDVFNYFEYFDQFECIYQLDLVNFYDKLRILSIIQLIKLVSDLIPDYPLDAKWKLFV
jgi:hypothetical protein